MRTFNVYLTYDETYSGGEPCAGQENCLYPDHEPGYIELAWGGATIGVAPKHTMTFDVAKINLDKPIDTVFAVVVRYTEGNTFGCTHGYHTVLGVYASLGEAKNVLSAFKRDETVPEGIWRSWDGYFASLDGAEIVEFRVDESCV